MVDLHCHILPGVDDGAKTVEDSITLLKKELEDGVNRIVLTPHFNPERISVEEFLEKRDAAFEVLKKAVDAEGLPVKLKLGAEVFFSAQLPELEMEKLCFQETPYLLVEFSPMMNPQWAPSVFYQMQLRGISPILAHVERYPYMLEDPTRLYKIAQSGVLLQVNASSLLKGNSRPAMIKKLLKWNLLDVISTDTHSMEKRPPLMKEALEKIEQWHGKEKTKELIHNGMDVFDGVEPQLPERKQPKQILGHWF